MSSIWIEGEISKELGELAASFPVVVMVGPRQVGKPSVLERNFADIEYVSLDVAAHAEMAETRPDDFLRLHPPPLVLDESSTRQPFSVRSKPLSIRTEQRTACSSSLVRRTSCS